MLNKGLIKDVELLNMPEGSWRNASNIVQNVDGTIENEKGFDYIGIIPTGFYFIGVINISSGVILFSVNGYVGEIGYFTVGAGYQRVIRDNGHVFQNIVFDSFKFNRDYPIEGTFYYNSKNEPIICWTDNLNAVRLLNTVTLNEINVTPHKIYTPSVLNSAQEIVELNLLNTFAFNSDFNTQYYDGNILNPILTQSNRTKDYTITDDNLLKTTITAIPFIRRLDTNNTYTKWYGGYNCLTFDSKKDILITNLDHVIISGYKAYQLGLVTILSGNIKFNIIAEHYTNGNVTYNVDKLKPISELDIAEVIIPKATFDTAKTITQIDNRLLLGNIKNVNIDYQKYANNINTTWEVSTNSYGYRKLFNSENEYVFCPDEVYAFYIHFILKDGTETMGYHIPGRIANDGDKFPEESIGGINGIKRFHIRDTSTIATLNNKLSYWENETELYPTYGSDCEIWNETGYIGTNANTHVRHHKIPSLKTTNGNTVKIKFSNIYIHETILNLVSGAYISFASRDKDKTVLDYSYIHNKSMYTGMYVKDDIKIDNTVFDLQSHPIDLLIEQAKVDINYLKIVYEYNQKSFKYYFTQTDPGICYLLESNVDFTNDDIIKVVKSAYIPRDFPTYNNEYSEAKLVFHTNSNANVIHQYYPTNGNTGVQQDNVYSICSINRILKDVYNPFNNQTLIPIENTFNVGRIIPNLDIYVTKGDMFTIDKYTFKESHYDSYGIPCMPFSKYTHCFFYYSRLKYATQSKFDNVTYENDKYNVEVTVEAMQKNDLYNTQLNLQLSAIPLEKEMQLKAVKAALETYLYYNNYPALNTVKALSPYTFNSNFNSIFKNRMLRSIVNNIESKEVNWRTFLANEYFELQRYKGEIIAIQSFNANLIIHTPYSTFLAKNKDVLLTNNIEAYLGKADILQNNPEQLIDLKEGYAGCIHQFARIITKYGYIYIDGLNGKIFLLKDSISEISNTGISKLLKLLIKKVLGDNPFKIVSGLSFGYDSEYERLLLTISDDNNNIYYTLSYSLVNGYWLSNHSYFPSYYFNINDLTYSITNVDYAGAIYKFNSNSKRGIYYHTSILDNTILKHKCFIEPIFVYDKTVNKLLENVFWQTVVLSPIINEVLEFKTITSIAIYSTSYFTGEIVIEDILNNISKLTTDRYKNRMYSNNNKGFYRNVEGQFNFNEIRDALVHNVTIDEIIQPETEFIDYFGKFNTTQIDKLGFSFTKEYFNKNLFIDRVFAVRLIYDNYQQNVLIIHNVDINVKKSSR